MMDISVIVTAYNLEKYIRECLDSILSQAGVEFEVICVDDASEDGTASILEEYAERDSRITVVRLPHNMGHASARNEGYRHAGGEYLYSIDGDDMLAEGALFKMYRHAKGNDLDLLFFSARAFFDDESLRRFGTEDDYVRKHEYPGVYAGAGLFALMVKNRDSIGVNRVLHCCRRSFFIENNLFDEEGLRYGDDSMFSYYMAAKRAMCIPDRLYLRRYRHGSTVTSPMKKRYIESMAVLFCTEMKRWRETELGPETNRQIETYFDMKLGEIGHLRRKFPDDRADAGYLEKYPAYDYFYRRFIRQEPLHSGCLTQEQMERIKRADGLILYGAGYMAGEVAKVLEHNSVFNYEVVVTETESSAGLFRGKRIKCIRGLEGSGNPLVIVAMAEKNKNDVMRVLEECGFSDVIWVSLDF